MRSSSAHQVEEFQVVLAAYQLCGLSARAMGGVVERLRMERKVPVEDLAQLLDIGKGEMSRVLQGKMFVEGEVLQRLIRWIEHEA